MDFKQNCWIVFNKPFGDERNDYNLVEKYQENCISKKIFGMGWHYKDDTNYKQINEIVKGKNIRDFNLEEILKLYEQVWNESALNSLKNYYNIKENDLIITRLINGNYYIGKVKGTPYHCNKKDMIENDESTERFSWCCDVEEWQMFSKSNLPGHIVGRLSQKRQKTIQRIAETEDDKIIKKLMFNIYYGKDEKIELNKENYTSALSYMDLEDLVFSYIIRENKEYILYPSQCKINDIKYEFDLVNKNDINKHITCQVKNKAKIDYNNYIEDVEQGKYEKIYLFSGIASSPKDYNIRQKENDRLKIIDKEKLYNYLISDDITIKVLKEKLSKFYLIKTNY